MRGGMMPERRGEEGPRPRALVRCRSRAAIAPVSQLAIPRVLTSTPSMPRFIKLTLSALVLVALAAGGRAYLARESAQPGSAQGESGAGPAPAAAAIAAPPMPVITVPVRVGIARVMVDAVGSLLADEAVVLRPEIDGRIQSLAFTEGQPVARGDALVALDPAEYEADVAPKEATRTSGSSNSAALGTSWAERS